MTEFAVQTDAVAQASRSARAATNDLAAELARLRRSAEEVLSAQWRGRAAAVTDRAWSSWHAAARAVIATLEVTADRLADVARDYRESDQLAATALRRAVAS